MKKQSKKVEAPLQEEEPKFQVSGDTISWDYKRGSIELSVETLDSIFYQYSKHGLNMTAVQVQNKHGFDALQWQSVKRTFDLVKDSDVFSPYSLSLVSSKEACEMIAKKMEDKFSPKNMRNVIEYEDNKQTKRAYEKAVKKAELYDYRRQQFEDALLEYTSQSTLAPLVKRTKDVKLGHTVFHIADLHAGADIEAERNLPAYNNRELIKKLKQAGLEVNQEKSKKVTLVINGDLIESFTGLSHINSWKNLDKKNGYGVNATIEVTEILTNFISSINNLHEVVILSGNHDRVTSNNKEDVNGEVAQWVAYMLKAKFGNNVTVAWEKDVAVRVIENVAYILTHGHHLLSKKNPELLINEYGVPGLFNLVIMAHLHTRKVLADGLNHRVIHAPSIFTGNNYSKRLGYSSRSGYLFIHARNKLPVVRDCAIQ